MVVLFQHFSIYLYYKSFVYHILQISAYCYPVRHGMMVLIRYRIVRLGLVQNGICHER